MKNRYYAVGEPVYPDNSIFTGRYSPSQQELEKSSLYRKPTIKLFRTFDEAKLYAHEVRQKQLDCAPLAKNTFFYHCTNPIFTLQLDDNFSLGNLFNEKSHRCTDPIDGSAMIFCFYQIKSNLITRADIIRVGFTDCELKPVEFDQKASNQTCVMC